MTEPFPLPPPPSPLPPCPFPNPQRLTRPPQMGSIHKIPHGVMHLSDRSRQVNVVKLDGSLSERVADSVAIEDPLEIRLGDTPLAVTMRTATEAKRRFLELLRTAEQRGEEVIITHRGEPKAVILSHDEYERLLETLEILSDRELLKKIRRGIAEASAGQTVSLDEAIE